MGFLGESLVTGIPPLRNLSVQSTPEVQLRPTQSTVEERQSGVRRSSRQKAKQRTPPAVVARRSHAHRGTQSRKGHKSSQGHVSHRSLQGNLQKSHEEVEIQRTRVLGESSKALQNLACLVLHHLRLRLRHLLHLRQKLVQIHPLQRLPTLILLGCNLSRGSQQDSPFAMRTFPGRCLCQQSPAPGKATRLLNASRNCARLWCAGTLTSGVSSLALFVRRISNLSWRK